jgi:PAS domain S-box-containing protein
MTGMSHEPMHAVPEVPEPPERISSRSASRSWILSLLDWFLSESMRIASPSELVRSRVRVGATLVLLVLALSYLVVVPVSTPTIAASLIALGWAASLLVSRKARSHTMPAVLLCASSVVGFLIVVFLSPRPYIGIHTGHMLVPALAVYLMGPRLAGILTGLFALGLGVLHPLYFMHVASLHHLLLDPDYLPIRVSAAIALLGAWAVGSLHSTARDEAQATLEHTLKNLRDSERKLSSLIASTDDPIISMDTQGRVLTANAAAHRIYKKRFGRPLEMGQHLVNPTDPSLMTLWRPRMEQVLQGHTLHFEQEQQLEDSRIAFDIRINPILGDGGKAVGFTLVARDVTHHKEAEARLGEMHRTLLDVSRQAGMAEISTGVLHNVGNTLNSVNVSTGLLAELLDTSRVAGLGKAAQLLQKHLPDLGTFLTTDPQGKRLPEYFLGLSEQLVNEHEALAKEVQALTTNVDHIKAIISMQQQQARAVGTIEQLQVPQLIDEALRLHAISLERLGISVQREYAEVPPIHADRHKLLQILVNLLTNARHALVESARQDRRLTIRVQLASGGQRLLIEVADNGMGIAPENLPRLFTQGFTTKLTGHGFGLHISALTAAEMKGQLRGTSLGLGLGATFSLELPLQVEQAQAAS